MATLVAEFMFRCAYDGCLSIGDMGKERRPYHKNCKCALHEQKGKCSHAGTQHNSVSFPKRELTSICPLLLAASTISSQSSCVSNSSFRSRQCIDDVLVYRNCSKEQCKR